MRDFSNLVSGVTKFADLYARINNNSNTLRSQFSGSGGWPDNPITGQPCFREDRGESGVMYVYTDLPEIGEAGWIEYGVASLVVQAIRNEVEASRGVAASLDARLGVAINDDGTLKSPAPASGWWTPEAGAVAYASETSFTAAGDKRHIYKAGRALKVAQTSSGHGYVAEDATYDGGEDLTAVEVVGLAIDAGISGVEYGQDVLNVPYHAARTDNPHLVTAEQVGALFLCEFYFFRHPTVRPGFQPAQGGLLADAATLYPEAWAYLQTAEGQLLCKSEAEWQAMTQATWHTRADGTKIGWNGIGGAPFYVQDLMAGTLRLPDIRGMYAEAAGFDSLGVGGVDGDRVRRTQGGYGALTYTRMASATGVFIVDPHYSKAPTAESETWDEGSVWFDNALVVPTGPANAPRRWGSLACVYLGMPQS